MLRTLFLLIIGAFVVLFASQNLEIVPVYIFTGAAVEVPLFMVIVVSFFAGFSAAIIGVIQKAVRRNKRKNQVIIDPRRGM